MQFSVVIATHNRCEYVLETIESVQNQRHAAYEIIVVSDGSTDDTARQVSEKFPDVIVLEQANLGRSVARNTGIARASGEWICFLDDDDLWHRDKLQAAAQYIAENPEAKAINHPVWYFSSDENGPKRYVSFVRDFVARNLEECHQNVAAGDKSTNAYDFLQVNGDSFRLLMERTRGILSASVVRRDIVIRAGGFSPAQRYGEDWTMFINVARLAEWHTISRRLGFTRLHAEQTTNDYTNVICILAGQVNSWYTGCPLPQPSSGLSFRKELRKYGPVYRQAIQHFFWTAVYSGHLRTAHLIWSLGKLLLPNPFDKAYALTPPQLTWRWERYVLGKHK